MSEQPAVTPAPESAENENKERRIALTPIQIADNEALGNYRLSTSVAALCKKLAEDTSVDIGGSKYVPASTMEAIAIAHGYVVSTQPVEWVPAGEDTVGGFRCVAELKNIKTGTVLAQSEGFVGQDEELWFGGEKRVWDYKQRKMVDKKYEKRPDFSIRSMVTTRACGRVCKLAFAHVLALMECGLETTPVEELIGIEVAAAGTAQPAEYDGEPVYDWREVPVHYGPKHGPGCDPDHPAGRPLGSLSAEALAYYQSKFVPDPKNPVHVRFRRALDISLGREQADTKPAGNGNDEPPA